MNYSSSMQSFFCSVMNIGNYSNSLWPASLFGMLYTVEYHLEIDAISKDEAC